MNRSCAMKFLMILLMLVSASSWADCRDGALEGDWTIFYRNNAYPTSVLAPGEVLSIHKDRKSGDFSVALSDREWRGWDAKWESVCVNDQTVLLGAIQRRLGATMLVIEISRVVRYADLLRTADGVLPERQINIRFPQPFGVAGQNDALSRLAEQGLLVSHPGHAHGWD